MKRLETIQRRKLASAYGGFGSIIETKDNGSLLIDDYSRWGCYSRRQLRFNPPRTVEDPRLLHFLQDRYPHLQTLYSIPLSDSLNVYTASADDLRHTKLSRYFPTWFYCTNPNCRELHRLPEWKEKWDQEFPNDHKFDKNYPACPRCSRMRADGSIYRRPLEQIRFCMASLDSGDLADIPFEKFFAPNVAIGGDDSICDLSTVNNGNVPLEYRTSASSDGLQSISIVSRGRAITMAQIAGPFILDQSQALNNPITAYKIVLRNGNNVYFPNIIHSLYIPVDNNQPLPNQLDYDNQEYYYITEPHGYDGYGVKSRQDFYSVRYDHLAAPFMRGMYAIHRLKENSVIPSYTRISNCPHRWWDIENNRVTEKMQPRSVVAKTINGQHHFLPIVESYGEGIFLDIDIANIVPGERDIFVHTLSHIIMKEIEFQCGYPLSSLREKIYRKEDQSGYGILIYTVGGAEGSYGGLVSLLPPEPDANTGGKLPTLIQNALERAKDCPNDPICLEEEGHCFACTDIPEISCCQWNGSLDRRIVLRYMP